MRKEALGKPLQIEEAELVQKCREGDAVAMQNFIETRLPRVRLILERWQDIDRSMQHILAHEVLMITLTHIQEGRYDPEKGPLAPYMGQICRNHISNYRRSRYWKVFCLDLTALEILKDSDIPDSVMDKLTMILNEEHKEDAFAGLLAKTIGEDALKKYRKKIFEASRKHLIRRNEDFNSKLEGKLDSINQQYDLEAKELQEKMEKVLKKLPEHYQRVLDMRYYEGLKTGEIAGKLKLDAGRVSNILSEAKKKIRELWPKKD